MTIRPRRPPTRRRSASSGRSSRRRSPRRRSTRDLGAGVGGRRRRHRRARRRAGSPRTTRAPPARLRATMLNGEVWHIVLAYVRPRARQQGVAPRADARGARRGQRPRLDPCHARRARRERGGGRGLAAARLRAELVHDGRAARVRRGAARRGRGRRRAAPLYVQTDDHDAVEQAVAKYLPRIGRSARTDVAQPSNGWTKVDDELCSPRSEGASPARPGALAGDGQHRADARDRGGRRRPLHPLGPRRDRRRVRIRPGALRPAAARRRRRARREPDGCAAADRRRPRPRARPSRATAAARARRAPAGRRSSDAAAGRGRSG